MKSAIFASSVLASLAAVVAAQDNSSCWMTLGLYQTGGTAPGGTYCAAPLPDFNNLEDCQSSAVQCSQEYTDCKATTQAPSSCLSLLLKCNNVKNFCTPYCTQDSNGNTPDTCNLATALAWNGVSTISSSSTPTPVVQIADQAPISTTAVINNAPISTAAAYNAPTTAAAYNAPTAAAYNAYNQYTSKSTAAAYNQYNQYTSKSMPVVAAYTPAAAAYNAYTSKPVNVYGAASTTAAQYNVYATPVVAASNTYVTYTPTVGICSVPTAYATPIGGFHPPIVACNDGSNYQTYPWKRYESHYTGTCPIYAAGWEAHACTEACTSQYNNCISGYANTFKTYSAYSGYKMRRSVPSDNEKRDVQNEKRTWWMFGAPSSYSTTKVSYGSTRDTLQTATAKCYAQYDACWTANRYLTNSGTCQAGGIYRAPSTQSGYNTYNAAARSYGSYNTGNSYLAASSYGGSTTNNRNYYKKK